MNKFYRTVKIINSCKTIEQLELVRKWISTRQGLVFKFSDYYDLQNCVIDKRKELNPMPYLVEITKEKR